MPDGKSGPRTSDSTFSPDQKLVAPDIHPRFISRIQRVHFEREEGAKMKLINAYCFLKKLTNQLHAYEEAFDKAQYKFLADKCETLCRNSRAAATSDGPYLSQILSVWEEVIDLRNIIAAATQGTYQDGSSQPVRPPISADNSGSRAGATQKIASHALEYDEHSLIKKLNAGNDSTPKVGLQDAGSHQSQRGHFSP